MTEPETPAAPRTALIAAKRDGFIEWLETTGAGTGPESEELWAERLLRHLRNHGYTLIAIEAAEAAALAARSAEPQAGAGIDVEAWIAGYLAGREDDQWRMEDEIAERAVDAVCAIRMDERAAQGAAPPIASESVTSTNAGSRLGSTTGPAGLAPARDVSDELELRDASSASPTPTPGSTATEPRTPGRCWCGHVRVSHKPWAAGEFCTNLKCGCRHYSEKRRGGEVIENPPAASPSVTEPEPGVKPVSTEQIAVAIFRLHRDGGAAWPMDACREEAERIVFYLTHDEAGRPVRWEEPK